MKHENWLFGTGRRNDDALPRQHRLRVSRRCSRWLKITASRAGAMSSIPPYYRGYRLALRDVQHATELYGNTLTDRVSVMGAVHKSADMVALELTLLKTADSEARREVREGESRVRAKMQFRLGTTVMNAAEAFCHGYRNGFDRALHLMTGHAWKMNDPKARLGILDVVMRLEQIRFDIASEEDGKIQTLRARKFAC